jgi:short-subunit dehydrogenase
MFKSKKVLIIGGTSGIGQMIANIFQDLHCDVISVGREQWNFNTEDCPYDLHSFDTVIFSAGIDADGNKNFFDQEFDSINLTLQTNLISQMRWFHQYCRGRKDPSRVFFVGSKSACEVVDSNKVAYCVSRIAIRAFVNAMRSELAEKQKPIQLVLLRPGATVTNFYRNKHDRTISDAENQAYYDRTNGITLDQLRVQIEPIIQGKASLVEEIIIGTFSI